MTSIFLMTNITHASPSCQDYLSPKEIAYIYGDFSPKPFEPYRISGDTLSETQQKAELIRIALKELFPRLQIYVEPKALPNKLDVFALLDFFNQNAQIIQRIFEGYTGGDIIFTNSTSISTYSDSQQHLLQLRFQVFNQFGSALFHMRARNRPLSREDLVEQWRLFLTMTTDLSPKLIK
jgi:hypothetical protein